MAGHAWVALNSRAAAEKRGLSPFRSSGACREMGTVPVFAAGNGDCPRYDEVARLAISAARWRASAAARSPNTASAATR